MEIERNCANCHFCAHHKKTGWYECRQFKIEVCEDDYCSFGKDIEDNYDEWRDEPYERKKYALD